MGTVIESASEFYAGRLTKKERKATLADELLSDSNLAQYRYGRNKHTIYAITHHAFLSGLLLLVTIVR